MKSMSDKDITPPLAVDKTLEVTIVEPSKTKRKRVQQFATWPIKEKKPILLTIDSSSEEEVSKEEVEASKEPEKVSIPSPSTSKSRQPWKPKIEKLNVAITNECNFGQNELYNDNEKLKIDIATTRYMVRNNIGVDEIKDLVNKKVYDRLVEKKAGTTNEDLELQKSMLKISCNTKKEKELKELLSNLNPYLLNKMRPIFLMVREKEILRLETQSKIDRMLTYMRAFAQKTSEVSKSEDTMQTNDQTDTVLEEKEKIKEKEKEKEIDENKEIDDIEQRAQAVIKYFDKKFKSLLAIVEKKAQVTHDDKLFSTICQKIRDDLIVLDTCIDELWKFKMEGKNLYTKCTLSYKFTTNIDEKITEKQSELEALTVQMGQPSAKVEDFNGRIFGVQTEVWKLHMEREHLLKILYDFRESLVVRISAIERQLDECLKAKTSYATFSYSDLKAIEIACYALCEIIAILK